jgi:hypothetical protein
MLTLRIAGSGNTGVRNERGLQPGTGWSTVSTSALYPAATQRSRSTPVSSRSGCM